jgi:hypothetical protein
MDGVPVVKTVVVAPALVTVTVGVCASTEGASSKRAAAERAERMAEGMLRVYRICPRSEPTGVVALIYRRGSSFSTCQPRGADVP